MKQKGPGRPRLVPGVETWDIHVRIPVPEFDAACVIAHRTNESISQLMRRALLRVLRDERGGTVDSK